MLALRTASRLRAPIARTRLYSTVVEAPVTPVVKKPASIRSGVVGFLLGSSVSGFAAWQYLAEEYKVQSEVLARDIDELRESVARVEGYVRTLQAELEEARKGRK